MKNFKPLVSILTLTASSMVFANPEGFQPLVGDANIAHPNGKTLEVTTGMQSIIQWDSFSIDTTETTRFVMPDSSASVLNRVLGGKMSEILGALEANGKIFLVNPKGVIVGEDAQVNTASFIASSFDLLNNDFMKGGDLAFSGEGGSVINLGKITAWDGDAVLIGYHVDNAGSIEAPNGVAGLAAGAEVFLRPASNERILVRATLSETPAGVGIENSGVISAMQTEMKADGNLYAYAIKDSGTTDALTVHEGATGRILLVADSGNVSTSGSLTAEGGEVRILGNRVSLLEGAHVNVSHDLGGGSALIGGDYKGSNPEIPNARYVLVEENTLVEADARIEGDGGKIIIWGTDLNSYFGAATARGGMVSGNGGFVEVSSKGLLVPIGDVNTLAVNGKTGELLLDPCEVIISGLPAVEAGFAAVPTCPTGVDPVSFDFTGSATSTIYASRISGLLTCTNVTVDASATGTAGFGSITISKPINWTTANTLTLVANDSPMSHISFLSNVNGALGTLSTDSYNTYVGSSTGALTQPVTVSVRNQTHLAANDFVIRGSDSGNASAQLKGRDLTFDVGNDLNVLGGNAIGSFAAITASGTSAVQGTITADVLNNILLQAGDASSASAAITGLHSNITLGDMTLVNQINVVGSDIGSYANAFIATYHSGFIEIATTGDVVLDAGIQPGANANIFTQGDDAFDSHINIETMAGDVLLKGGGAP